MQNQAAHTDQETLLPGQQGIAVFNIHKPFGGSAQFMGLPILVWILLAVATVLKIWLAATTYGTTDVLIWTRSVQDVRVVGELGLYYQPYKPANYFNHPPFMTHFVSLISWLWNVTQWPPSFWIRSLCALADIGTVLILSKILRDGDCHPVSNRLIPFICAPATLLLSGFHGNTDPIMMFFVVLSIMLLQGNYYLWLAGIAFGMSLNIKIVPLMFLPVIFLFLGSTRRIAEYLMSAFAIVIVGGLPLWLQDAPFILDRLFSYSGLLGCWGWSRFFSLLAPDSQIYAAMAASIKFILIALIIAISLWMNKLKYRPPLPTQFTIIVILFLTVSAAFGNQYLGWLMPLLCFIDVKPRLFLFGTTSLMLVSSYAIWWRYQTAFSMSDVLLNQIALASEIFCWFALLATLATVTVNIFWKSREFCNNGA